MGEDPQAETVAGAITFSTPYFSAPSSRAPPLLGEAELPPKPSRVEEPPLSRGRTLGERGSRDWGPTDHSQDARERQGDRPGEVQAAWWASSSEEVSLQLVGGRPGTSISLAEDSSLDVSRKSSTPDQQLAEAQDISSTPTAHLRQPFTLVDDGFAPTDQAISLFNIGTFEKPPKKTPSTDSSTKSSLVSAASSYAHQLCRRANMRLMRKRFKPLQHTSKKHRVAKVKATPPLRSPTYGIPKVVEDSRDDDQLDQSGAYDSLQAFLDNSTKVAVTSLKLPPPKHPRKKTSSHTSAERRTDSPSTKQRDPPSKKRSTSPTLRQPKSSKMKRPGILRSSASLDIVEATKTHHHHQRGGGGHRKAAAILSRAQIRESANYNKQAPNPLIRQHSGQSQSQKTQHSSSSRSKPSPPNLDPLPGTPRSWGTGKSETNPFQTDDNYFSSLRTKMSSRHGFTPTLSLAEPDRPFMRRAVEISQVPEKQQQKRHQEIWTGTSSEAMEKRQKRGSIFGALGLPGPIAKLTAGATADTVSLQEKFDDRAISPGHCSSAGHGVSSPAWPKVSTAVMEPVKLSWRRMSEDMTLPLPLTLPPYFARNRRRQGDSDPPQFSGGLSPTTAVTNASGGKDSESSSGALQKRRASNFDMGQVSPFTPLPPLREDYDRNRHVSIEIPGTPGVHHRPGDTPRSSPATVMSEASKVTMVRRSSQSDRSSPSHKSLSTQKSSPSQKSLSTRKSSLRPASPAAAAAAAAATPSPPASATTPSPAAPVATAAVSPRESSIYRDIGAELNGAAPKARKSPTSSYRPLQNRRSALTPIARQATHNSTATNNITPLKRTLSHFRKPQRTKSLLPADRSNNIKE
jgi:hypothetical protein